MNQNQSEGVEQAAQPTLCVAGCGFFANTGTMGLCSKCYRDHAASEEKKKAAEAAVGKAHASLSTTSACPPPSAPAVSRVESPPQLVEPPSSSAPAVPSTSSTAAGEGCGHKSPTRCLMCRKKVGLTGFKCKCGETFCGQHRYAESHNCTFDYKSEGRQKLADSNPVVQASKIQKI